jgi:UDP-3-O-[3-hydroxymyristoyl] N-acetylglucosamine deacetylase
MIEFRGPGIKSRDNCIRVEPSNGFRLRIMSDDKCEADFKLNDMRYSVDDHMVSIGNGKCLKAVEHFFSALYGLEIFKINIQTWAEEFPIFDGSSIEYTKRLLNFNHGDAQKITIDRPVSVRSGDSFLDFTPGENQQLKIDMEFFHPFINTQKLSVNIDRDNYTREIAPARTFAFTTEDDERLKNLPPYGIGVTAGNIYSREPLRFTDELIRHKILDLLGDLFFIGGRLCGRIGARNTYHKLNHAFVEKLKLQNP